MNFGPVRNLQKGDDKAAEEEAMIAKSAEPELKRKHQAAMPNEAILPFIICLNMLMSWWCPERAHRRRRTTENTSGNKVSSVFIGSNMHGVDRYAA